MSTLKLVVEDPLAAYDEPLEQINEGFNSEDEDEKPEYPSKPNEQTIEVNRMSDSTKDIANEQANTKDCSDKAESNDVPERKKSKQAILVKSEDFENFEVINEFDNSSHDEVCRDVDVESDGASVTTPLKGLDSNVISMDVSDGKATQDETDSIDPHTISMQENYVKNQEANVDSPECSPFKKGESNSNNNYQLIAQNGDENSIGGDEDTQLLSDKSLSRDLSGTDFLYEKEPNKKFIDRSDTEKNGEFESLNSIEGITDSFIVLETEKESETGTVCDSHQGSNLDIPSAHLNEQQTESPDNEVESACLTEESKSAADEIDNNSMGDNLQQTICGASVNIFVKNGDSEFQILADSPLTKRERANSANEFSSPADTQLTPDIWYNNGVHVDNNASSTDSTKSRRLSADNIVLERPPPTPTVVYDSIILEPDLSNFEELVGSFPGVREHRSSTFDFMQNSANPPSSLKPRRSFDEYNSLTATLSDSFQSLISNKSVNHKQPSNTEEPVRKSPESSSNGTRANDEQLVNEFVFSPDGDLKTQNVFDITRNDTEASDVVMVTAGTNENAMETYKEADDTFDYLKSISIPGTTHNNESTYNMFDLNNEAVFSNTLNVSSGDNDNKHDTEKKLGTSSENPVLFSPVETDYDFLDINREHTWDGEKSEDSGREKLFNFDIPDFAQAKTGTSDQKNFDFSNPFESFESIEIIPDFGEGNEVTTGLAKIDVNARSEDFAKEAQNSPLSPHKNLVMKSEDCKAEPEFYRDEFVENDISFPDFDRESISVKSADSTTNIETRHEEPDRQSDFTVSTESLSSKSWDMVTDTLVNLNENTKTSNKSATEENETKLLKIDASGFNFDDSDDKSQSSNNDAESLEIISEDESHA